jgi:hypothetical protein
VEVVVEVTEHQLEQVYLVDLVEVVLVIVLVLEDQEIHLQQLLLKEIMEELVIIQGLYLQEVAVVELVL